MGKYTDMLEAQGKNAEAIGEMIPKLFEANANLAGSLGNYNTTDPVTKELMFLSFAIATRCEGCIAFHAKQYKEAGGSREALAELYAISVLMQGGPGGVYAGKVLEAFDEYSK